MGEPKDPHQHLYNPESVFVIISRIGAFLPRGWGDLFLQLALYVLANTTYEIARGLADGRANQAFANGERIIDIQRSTGTFFEPAVQSWLVGEAWLIDIANFIYLNSQFTVVLAFLVWLYLYRNDQYYFFRNVRFVSMALALVGYIGFPTAPPRMFPEYGFIDTVNAQSSVNHNSDLAQLFINPFAAVPSMHSAFALMFGVMGFKVYRNKFVRAWWLFWPILVASVTVVTANHYWIDAALGWMVAGLSFLIASTIVAQIQPGSWAWTRLPDQPRSST